MANLDGIKHRKIHVNGINMHIAEKGDEGAPIVLFIHGFPELWYSWRYQILSLSALGYRAVAPDMRGYGDTDAPQDVNSYTYTHIVGDLVALIDELGAEQVFVVGHDWGAVIAWWFCVFRPDRVKALVNLSVPFIPRDPKQSIMDKFRATYGDDYYTSRFQEPGDIETEIVEAGGVDKFLRKFISGCNNPAPLFLPKGKVFKDVLPYPEWLSSEDLSYYINKFTHSGFTGGLNYYRAANLSWELMAPWVGVQVQVPVKFVVGDLDMVYHMVGLKEYIHNGGMKIDVPQLQEVVILKDVAHFLQQEKPDVVTNHIYDFIRKF